MKCFPLLASFVAAVVFLSPVIGPLVVPAWASVTTNGDVNPGGTGTQPDPWTIQGGLFVGRSHGGTLNIAAGGVVSNTTGYIGFESDSTGVATVTGSGSQWNNLSNLRVGHAGNGTLNVETGGVVSNAIGYIGRDSDSTGVATVTGSGSQWNNLSFLNVGRDGSGILNVEAGGGYPIRKRTSVELPVQQAW